MCLKILQVDFDFTFWKKKIIIILLKKISISHPTTTGT